MQDEIKNAYPLTLHKEKGNSGYTVFHTSKDAIEDGKYAVPLKRIVGLREGCTVEVCSNGDIDTEVVNTICRRGDWFELVGLIHSFNISNGLPTKSDEYRDERIIRVLPKEKK